MDLTGLWHRETELVGAYTYGTETLADGTIARTFDLAMDTAEAIEAERWLSATYPLADHVDAIAHAAAAGRRGAIKIAFDSASDEEPALNAPSRLRPRRRPLDPAHADLERRGAQPRQLPADRSRVIYAPEPLPPSTTSTARSATPC